MNPVRVLVVDDSLTVRRRLSEVLSEDPDIAIVGEASNGQQAIDLCASLKPDVVTMDMVLPGMPGLTAIEHIMAHCPTPILVVSSAGNRGDLFRTYEALAAGAVDVLDKPDGTQEDPLAWERRLRSSVKLVSRIRVITHMRASHRLHAQPRPAPAVSSQVAADPHVACRLIAIGASTGGPAALVAVLRELPSPLPVPALVVQHINSMFAQAFAEWLNAQSALPVRYAVDGEPLDGARGQVVLAPPDVHLAVRGGILKLEHSPPRHSCRPSVDVLFESIANDACAGTIACLLTGMGRDGASGLLAIRRAGGHTIAQDESTSAVYGMPREAARLDAALQILPLSAIGPVLANLSMRERGKQA